MTELLTDTPPTIALDFGQLSPRSRYKLMTGLIVPRPIALVTTLGEAGVVNAAPFSLFNMMGEDPPLVVVSVSKKDHGALKDTARNILRGREFVVHLCDEPMAEAMHACSAELPPEVSEVECFDLPVQPSNAVRPPRITRAPVAFECVLDEHLENASRHIFLGRVLWMHARQGLVDLATHRVKLEEYTAVGRFGAGLYVRTGDRFSLGD